MVSRFPPSTTWQVLGVELDGSGQGGGGGESGFAGLCAFFYGAELSWKQLDGALSFQPPQSCYEGLSCGNVREEPSKLNAVS